MNKDLKIWQAIQKTCAALVSVIILLLDQPYMTREEVLFEEFCSLAEVISLEYANIPGVLPSEVLSEAHIALNRACANYDETRGDFTPYARKAVRNALNTFYAKQLRMARIFPVSLDDSPSWDSLSACQGAFTPLVGKVKDPVTNVVWQVRQRESAQIIAEVLSVLSPRERTVVDGIKAGRSLSEIGETLGVSKQAIHKISMSAFPKIRERLSQLGYGGIDSKGLLRSRPRVPSQVDDFLPEK